MGWFVFLMLALTALSLCDLASMKCRRVALVAMWLLLTLSAGLRNMGGVDYDAYRDQYNGIDSESYFETGYCWSVDIGNFLGLSYNGFILVLTGITLFFLLRFYWKYSSLPLLSIVLYVGLYFFYYNMILLRQMVAVVFFLYALQFIREKKTIGFLLTTFAGSLFHLSILVVIPVYFYLRYFKISLPSLLILFGISVAVYIGGLLFFLELFLHVGLSLFVERAIAYAAADNFQTNVVEYLKMAAMLSLLAVTYKRIAGNYANEVLVKCYLAFCVLLLCFGRYEVMFRVAMYFDLALTLLVPLMIGAVRMNLRSKVLIYLLAGAVASFSLLWRLYKFDNGSFTHYTFFFLQ